MNFASKWAYINEEDEDEEEVNESAMYEAFESPAMFGSSGAEAGLIESEDLFGSSGAEAGLMPG